MTERLALPFLSELQLRILDALPSCGSRAASIDYLARMLGVEKPSKADLGSLHRSIRKLEKTGLIVRQKPRPLMARAGWLWSRAL